MASFRDYHRRFDGDLDASTEPSQRPPPEYTLNHSYSGNNAGSYLMRDASTSEQRGSALNAQRGDQQMRLPDLDTSAQKDGNHLLPPTGKGEGLLTPDTPSQYTDPFEYNTVVSGAAGGMVNTHGGANYLSQDPYTHVTTSHSKSGDVGLDRSNTVASLAPDDSVSMYRIKARSRELQPLPEFGEQHRNHAHYTSANYNDASLNDRDLGTLYAVPHRGSIDQNPRGDGHRQSSTGLGFNNYGQPQYREAQRHHTSADYYAQDASARQMGYADDEDEEKRRREHYWNDTAGSHEDDDEYYAEWDPKDYKGAQSGPTLLSNNMLGPSSHDAAYSKDVHADEDRRGLLGALKGMAGGGAPGVGAHRPRPGWGGTLGEQIERRRAGLGRQRFPLLSWALGVAYVAVFIVELIKAKSETGQAIQTKPTFNPMIGPPYEFLISFGARFVPCMRQVPDLSLNMPMTCLKDSAIQASATTETCPLYQICGLPNASAYGQSWRFVTPIFVHAGFVHIAFNLLAQLTLCAQMERIISSPLYALVYAAGGIGGNLLGGNFGLVGLPSVGASGAIYACISLELVDLLYNWKFEYKPKTRLVASIIFIIIGLAIGLLPGLDNFAHIGGFAVGILGGLMLGPSIHETRRHKIITWFLRVAAAGLLIGFCG